jgi:putative membrane protein insertion efficiency factor
MKIIKFLDFAFRKLLIYIVKLYKKITPADWSYSCKFVPTCSTYAIDALTKKNSFFALYLITRRLIRCSPLTKGGLDQVK